MEIFTQGAWGVPEKGVYSGNPYLCSLEVSSIDHMHHTTKQRNISFLCAILHSHTILQQLQVTLPDTKCDRQVYQALWWMGHYGSLTMKRHIAWSNCRTVKCFDLGVMCKAYQQKHFRHGAKSARTYTNKKGKPAYHGTKYLKGTQTLSCMSALIKQLLGISVANSWL